MHCSSNILCVLYSPYLLRSLSNSALNYKYMKGKKNNESVSGVPIDTHVAYEPMLIARTAAHVQTHI